METADPIQIYWLLAKGVPLETAVPLWDTAAETPATARLDASPNMVAVGLQR